MAKNVFSGLVTAWRLAAWPTSRSPHSVKATIDGVVRAPSLFSITLASLPSITATQELVVPRSIPMTFAMTTLLSAGPHGPGGAARDPNVKFCAIHDRAKLIYGGSIGVARAGGPVLSLEMAHLPDFSDVLGRRRPARRAGGADPACWRPRASPPGSATGCSSRPSACSAPARSSSAAPTTACQPLTRDRARGAGVVAFSSGNHAQGVACAGAAAGHAGR